MINPSYQKKGVKTLEWIFLYLAITDALAFTMGNTTLTLKYLAPIVIASKYVFILTAFILIGRLRLSLNYKYVWVPIVIWLVYFLSSLNGKLFVSPLALMILGGFCILPNIIKANVYRKYRQWIILMCGGGILAYMSFVLNLGLPYTRVDYYSINVSAYYVDYIFSILCLGIFDIRLCGLFNEPGYLGTIVALILIIEDCNLKKVGNVIMLLAGVLTFSLAFYVLLIIYFLMRMIKNVTTVIITVCAFALIFNYIQNTQFEDPQVQYLVNRFKFDKTTGEMSGDNRTSYDFELAYQRMIDDGDLLLGKGSDSMEGKFTATSSYKALIYKHGLIGFIVIVGSMFIASYPIAKRNREALIFLLCFFVSIYQRPNVFTLVYFCLLFGGLAYLKEKSLTTKLIENEKC